MPINKSTQLGYLGTILTGEGIFDMYEQELIFQIPEFIGTSSNNITNNVTSIDFAVPSGTQNGDFAVAMLSGGGGQNDVDDWANSQGFTFLYENTTRPTNSAIAYKVLDGTEGANFTFTTTNSCKLSGEVVVYRGSNRILSSSENLDTSGSASSRTATSINASRNTILFAFFTADDDNTVFTNVPSDLTLLRTYSNSHKHNYWIGYKTVITSGPTGNYTIQFDGTTTNGAGFLFTI